MSLSEATIQAALERYRRDADRYARLSELVARLCEELVADDVVRASVQWRAKSPAKLERKLRGRYAERVEDDVDAVFRRVGDLAAVRILTYVESDRPRVVELVQETFEGPERHGMELDRKDGDGDFYRATHCRVVVPRDLLEDDALRGLECELQVCSMLAHVWNELAHDLTYKPSAGEPSAAERDALDALGHQMLAGDGLIMGLLDTVASRRRQDTDAYADAHDFVSRARRLFPDASEFQRHAGQLFRALRELGITSPRELGERVLSDVDDPSEAGARWLARFRDAVGDDWDARHPRLDEATSDRLLALVLRRFAQELAEASPPGGGLRPSRVRYAARSWIEAGLEQAAPADERAS